MLFFSFFFNVTPPTIIYTLSLHDALPIYRFRWRSFSATMWSRRSRLQLPTHRSATPFCQGLRNDVCLGMILDRKSTRLNSSHTVISYAVFCLKKKKKKQK